MVGLPGPLGAVVRPASLTWIEARVRAEVGERLDDRGWEHRLIPYTGYAADGWVRVLARVVLAPPGTRSSDVSRLRGWRRFLSIPIPGADVTVEVGDRVHRVSADAEGYVDVRLDADLEPGWASARLTVEGGARVQAPVRVVGPDSRLGMVSDIDDTVIVTMNPRPLLAFRNTFWVRERDRVEVPGMAELYDAVLTRHPDAFVVYLSTGAWNVAGAMRRFLEGRGYPPGPLLMTDWGPSQDAWFRSGRDHKRRELARLFEDLPQLRWLLVGDDGQHDPSLYAQADRAHPGRVEAILIRQLSAAEQIATHGTPGPLRNESEQTSTTSWVSAPDGSLMLAGLRERGLLKLRPPER